MTHTCRAYLDIETTGLSEYRDEITVVGICVEKGRRRFVTQLYEDSLSEKALLDVLRPAEALYTYNGARFDLRFIRHHLRADLTDLFEHCDLMHHCHRQGLYGGLKVVEHTLGIPRKTEGVDGWMAVQLWLDYRENGNRRALAKLLKYNAEDVCNLIHLRKHLGIE